MTAGFRNIGLHWQAWPTISAGAAPPERRQRALESLHGLRGGGESLYMDPVLPPDWTQYRLSYRHRQTDCKVVVHAAQGGAESRRILFNGKPVEGDRLLRVDDGGEHHLDVYS
ncbi:hypothetical protein [Dyella choica]|uniref:Uncharacterized protein n=1 Tax=Dyella choica TaxID=1927959 RepID=A0A432M1Y0_9GAMM|nr:hypothetical protein [Dyella choica]RUL71874.1 hypothetical protein EKH80_18455 [Dyella choica]